MNLFSFLTQPSTMKGISLIVGSSMMTWNPEMFNQILAAVAAAVGMIETFRNENKETING